LCINIERLCQVQPHPVNYFLGLFSSVSLFPCRARYDSWSCGLSCYLLNDNVRGLCYDAIFGPTHRPLRPTDRLVNKRRASAWSISRIAKLTTHARMHPTQHNTTRSRSMRHICYTAACCRSRQHAPSSNNDCISRAAVDCAETS